MKLYPRTTIVEGVGEHLQIMEEDIT